MKFQNLFKIYREKSQVSKALVWFTICNLLLKGISFITVPLFTRLLSTEEYGILSIFLTYDSLFLILSTWEIYNGAYQRGVIKYKNDIQNFTLIAQIVSNIITFLFFSIIFIFSGIVYAQTNLTKTLLSLMLINNLVFPTYNFWIIRNRTDYNYKPAVLSSIGYSIFTTLASIWALYFYGRTGSIKYGSFLVASILFCLPYYLSLICKKTFKISLSKFKEQGIFLIKFQAPLVIHSLSFLVLNQADRIMIGKLVGNSSVALYSVAYSLASVVSIIQNSINQTMLPWRYQKLEEKEYEDIGINTYFSLILFGIAILGFICLAPEIMKILFSESYMEAIWCIPPISAGVFFIFLYSIFVNIESYYEETQFVMYISLICAVLNIMLNYFGILTFGYIASAYTTLFCYILFSIGHYYCMKYILKKKKVKSQIFKGYYIFGIGLTFTILSFLTTFCYNYFYIRLVILLLLIFLLVVISRKNTDRLKQIF